MKLEKSLKETDAETQQILQKISAELESQKQMATWNSTIQLTDEYSKLVGPERYGNICSLTQLISNIGMYIDTNNLTLEDLQEVRVLLGRISLPLEEDKLYSYEIPYIIDYNRSIRRIDKMIESILSGPDAR